MALTKASEACAIPTLVICCANIRQALLDLIGPQGTKKAPGPTYGVRSHEWAALAVAVTVAGLTPESMRAAA